MEKITHVSAHVETMDLGGRRLYRWRDDDGMVAGFWVGNPYAAEDDAADHGRTCRGEDGRLVEA